MDAHPLTPLIAPRSIVVLVGSQPSAQAELLLAQIKAQRFQGEFAIADVQRSGTLAELSQARADLAVLALPQPERAAGVELAGRIGCRAALLLGSGAELIESRQLAEIAERERLHLLGPNSLGLQNPALGLNASLAGPLARPGGLALVSQSGALTSTLLDWAQRNAVGFSKLIHVGPHSPVDVAELLMALAHDRATQAILLHVEGFSDARRFMSALRLAASSKPVLVLKTGRRQSGQEQALTHSGSLAHRDEVFDAALRRCGAVRVDSATGLFAAARLLGSSQLRSRYRGGLRLGLLSNGSGPAVMAADRAEQVGLQIAAWQDLPVQPGEAADFAAPLRALQAEVDALLVLHAPLLGADPEGSAQGLVDALPQLERPLLSCWLGEGQAEAARARLGAAGIPSFRTPEAAVGAFAHLADYHAHQRLLQQVPAPLDVDAPPQLDGARLLVDSLLAQRRSLLTEMESKSLLAAFHIPVTTTLRAASPHEAMLIASQLGYPVALKIEAEGISHKAEVGGVMLGLRDAAAVRDGYERLIARVRRARPEVGAVAVTVQPMAAQQDALELHIGLKHESPFGPVIVFGAGGAEVELIADVAMELPPLNRFLAQQLMRRARVWRHLQGLPAAVHEQLEALLLRVSEMACELPQLREMDINPLLVDAFGLVAVDARVLLADQPLAPGSQPYRHLAIRPYPAQLSQSLPLRDGRICQLRAIRPDDAAALQQLVAGLSPQSRYNRFAATLTELPPALLARFSLIDYEREMALVALLGDEIVGVARYTTNPGGRSAEFALLVADSAAGQGLGRRLMEALMAVAREQGLAQLDGLVLRQNDAMLKLVRGLGFAVQPYADEPDFRLVTRLL